MRLYISKRKTGMQPGGKGGGWIKGGMGRIAVLKEEPQEDIAVFLLENFGEGEYMVSAHGSCGHFMNVFSGTIGSVGEDGVVS